MANIRAPIWVVDVEALRFVWANKAALALWDSPTNEEFRSRDLAVGISPTVRERLLQHVSDLRGTSRLITEHWTLYPKGVPQSFECLITEFTMPGSDTCLLIQALLKDEAPSADTLYRANALLHTSMLVSVYNEAGEVIYSNPAARRVYGSNRRSLPAHFCDEADWVALQRDLDEAGRASVEAQVNIRSGKAWHSLTFESCPDPIDGANTILVSEFDITERREAQQRIHELAYVDTLTGLHSRSFLVEALAQRVETAHENGDRFAILFIDLDRFKLINDSLGHATGDKLLRAAGKRLQASLNDEHIVSRMGGDEFNVLMPVYGHDSEVESLARRIHNKLSYPLKAERYEFQIGASIGASIFPEHGEDASTLMRHADLAMYSAKRSGGGVKVFEQEMAANVQERLRIENDLRSAAENDQFFVHYQPKVDGKTRRVVGMEALVRWRHPTLGVIDPNDFIGIAEQIGMITKISSYVLTQALRQLASWQSMGYALNMAINLSPSELRSPDIVDLIYEVVSATVSDPACVEFEITESMLMDDSLDIRQTLDKIKSLGCKLTIDDFGTGYSNLAYLQKFSLDSLKIDRSFLIDVENEALVELIIKIGKTLSLSVVAEGVEKREQCDWLIEQGCDEMQGYFFSKPLAADSATRFLQNFVPLSDD